MRCSHGAVRRPELWAKETDAPQRRGYNICDFALTLTGEGAVWL